MSASAPSVKMKDSVSREFLPPEVLEFLSVTTPQTLTVRGPPGVGKTTFALTLLEQFDGYRAYVSARVPKPSVLRDHPWVNSPDSNSIDLVEMLRFRGGAESSSLRMDSLRDALQARANDLVELSSVLSLPDQLEKGFVEHAGKPMLVVIDSWEAWVENTLGPMALSLNVPTTRWELERSMLDRVRQAGAHVLLVVEREDRERLDYIADGALSLTVAETDGRAERWLTFQKLRGIKLGCLTYPFTLEAGRFRCIQPGRFHAPVLSVPDEPDPEPAKPDIWPGSTAFATRLGRLPIPGATLLEADGETPVRLLLRLVVPMISSALRSGGHVVFRPPSHFSSREIWTTLGHVQWLPNLAKSLRILSWDADSVLTGIPESTILKVTGQGPNESHRIVGLLDSTGFFRGSLPQKARSLVVLFMDSSIDSTGAMGDPDSFLALLGLARQSGNRVGIVLVARSTETFIESLRSRSLLHLLIHSSRGQFFMSGTRPWTPNFVFSRPLSGEEETIPYGLIPIV
jgi:KaiC/GvpD/RAD55 family RecA-like ATPase